MSPKMTWRCLCCRKSGALASEGFEEHESDGQARSPMPMNQILTGMSLGTVLYKLRPPDRTYRRKYRVDLPNLRLSYSPSTKHFWTARLSAAFKCASAPRLSLNVVDLFDLLEVRTGWHSDVFNKLEAKFRRKLQATLHPKLRALLREENCLSLVITPGPVVVDLIAPNAHARDAWVRGLRHLIATCALLHQQHDEEWWLQEQARLADKNGNGSLTFEEILLLLNQLNISMRRREARVLYDEANFKKKKIDGEDALEPEEFVKFYRSLVQRPELEEIMTKYSANKSMLWSVEELRNFLQTEQNMVSSTEECEAFIEQYEPSEKKIPGYLSMKGFEKLLLSPDHNIFNKSHRLIYQDMTQPLNHYYIASSHNTYLLGGQLIGESSIEGYIQALMRGCRCLELDIWDGPDDEPIIFHGYTLTSRILLRDVLEAISKYAFRASQYPVILSIENHCSLPMQEKMAHYFDTILGDYLYREDVLESETQYPSPEDLARKIFLKGKKPREHSSPEGGLDMDLDDFLLEDEEEREAALAAAMTSEDFHEGDLAAAPTHTTKTAPELSALVNYFAAQRFTSFADCRICWHFSNMASFEETKGLRLGSTDGGDFVEHNRRHMSRVYPRGTRTDSSNYDPVPFWNVGCQIVALNYQTWDEHMYINEAKFLQNGRCGYVLKPKYLNDKVPYDPSKRPNPGEKLKVTITIISAQFLPKPNWATEGEVVDPYVSVKVVGHALDSQKKKTKFISNNGFNPRWNEVLEFEVYAPEEAIINIRVRDQGVTSNVLIGQFALPLTSLMEGYRHVHLEDNKSWPLDKATLFVHVKITQYAQYRKTSTR